jgi:hypothetical protein
MGRVVNIPEKNDTIRRIPIGIDMNRSDKVQCQRLMAGAQHPSLTAEPRFKTATLNRISDLTKHVT